MRDGGGEGGGAYREAARAGSAGEDGVLWGFHGWCSREFAYRASVTSPLAPAPAILDLEYLPARIYGIMGTILMVNRTGVEVACDSASSELP